MVIFFNVPEVRNHLLTGGFVYTLRIRRREGRDVAVTGSRYSYTVIADVMVEEVKPILNSFELQPYVQYSGLLTADSWLQLAKGFYRNPVQLWLYRVKLLRRRAYL